MTSDRIANQLLYFLGSLSDSDTSRQVWDIRTVAGFPFFDDYGILFRLHIEFPFLFVTFFLLLSILLSLTPPSLPKDTFQCTDWNISAWLASDRYNAWLG